MKQGACVLEMASEELKADKEVPMKAFRQYGYTPVFVFTKELYADKEGFLEGMIDGDYGQSFSGVKDLYGQVEDSRLLEYVDGLRGAYVVSTSAFCTAFLFASTMPAAATASPEDFSSVATRARIEQVLVG